LNEEIKVEKKKFRELDRNVREEGRAKSEEHRQSILKAHYNMQKLKSTIASIKANRYSTNISSNSLVNQSVILKKSD
jgi:hypothetical protein